MKKRFAFGILAAIMACSCQEEELNVSTLEPSRFTASIEDNYGGATKTSLDGNGNVLWTKGDQVSVFDGNTVNAQYQVTDDSDGKTSASLSKVASSEYTAGTAISNNVAYYPYASGVSIAKSGTGYEISGIVLPSTQTYAEASFANGAFPMAAITGSTEDKNLGFKNILGGLKLQLKGTAKVASISVRGNANEVLCGAATVAVSTAAVPEISLTEAPSKTVTLNCGTEGVQLGSDAATSFIIALPPMSMDSGFTVTVEDTDGKQMEITTSRSQTITRSSLLKMPVVEYVGEASNTIDGHEFVDLGLPSGVKWSNIDLGAESSSENGLYYGWGEVKGYASTKHDFSAENNITSIGGSGSYQSYGTSNDPLKEYLIGGLNYGKTLPSSYDAASVSWGNKWRIPTLEEFQELIDECTWTKTSDGFLVTSKTNGNSITFRNAGVCQNSSVVSKGVVGRYWSQTPDGYRTRPLEVYDIYNSHTDTYNSMNSYTQVESLYTDNTGSVTFTGEERYHGALIRPVSGPVQAAPAISSVNISDPTSSTVTASVFVSCSGTTNIDEMAVVYEEVGTSGSEKALAVSPTEGYNELIITSLKSNTKYEYYVSITNSIGTSYSPRHYFQTLPSSEPTTMGAIDLDLPSGTLWASKNVGAITPEHMGKLYGWGEATGYYSYCHYFSWSEHFKAIGGTGTCDDDCQTEADPLANIEVLSELNDAAYIECGHEWRMPTYAQVQELIDNCTWTWDYQNGAHGYVVASKTNPSKYIFLPCEDKREYAINESVFDYQRRILYWTSSDYYIGTAERYEGVLIRPVTQSDSSVPKTAKIGSITMASTAYTDASVSCQLVDDGNLSVECGFIYGTSESQMTRKSTAKPNDDGDFSATLRNLASGTTYYIKAYATNEVGTVESEVVTFTTKSLTGTLNGYKWVDIGIRKSHYDTSIEAGSDEDRRIVFACQNIGASQPTNTGYFFRGGEKYGWKYSGTVSTYTSLDSSNLVQVDNEGNTIEEFSRRSPGLFSQNDFDYEYGIVEDFYISYTTGDAVSYYYGDGWQYMPGLLANIFKVQSEYYYNLPNEETINNTTLSGVVLEYTRSASKGLTIKNKNLGTSVFFPCSGYLDDNYYKVSDEAELWLENGSSEISLELEGSWGYYTIMEECDYDYDAEAFTNYRYYWGVTTAFWKSGYGAGQYDGSNVYTAHPIRAIAELPL